MADRVGGVVDRAPRVLQARLLEERLMMDCRAHAQHAVGSHAKLVQLRHAVHRDEPLRLGIAGALAPYRVRHASGYERAVAAREEVDRLLDTGRVDELRIEGARARGLAA